MIEGCKLGFIGAGNMGGALIAGLLEAGRIPATHITAVDPRPEVLRPLSEIGVRTSSETLDAVCDQDVVVLGIKPQIAPKVLPLIGPHLGESQVLLSIMAGVSTVSIESQFAAAVPVVRVMPQTLARLGAAASGMCGGRHATREHLALVRTLLDEVGSSVEVSESQMDAVTGLSGSGPAYVYTIVEALVDGGVRVGLPREVALKLAAQTLLGAARMVLESGVHPAVLKDQVTSPGGTTIAALHKLEEKGLRDALISAVQAATERSIELGKS